MEKYKVGQKVWKLDYNGVYYNTQKIEILNISQDIDGKKIIYHTKYLDYHIYHTLQWGFYETEQELIDIHKKSFSNPRADLFITSKNCFLSELKYKLREQKLNKILNGRTKI